MNRHDAQQRTPENDGSEPMFEPLVRTCRHESSGSLPMPALDSVEGTVLDPSLGKVVVRIAAYPHMACGDRVVLNWHGLDIEGLPYRHEIPRSVSDAQVGKEIVFVVREPHIAALDGGSLEVFWVLTSVAQAHAVSSVRKQLDVGDVRHSLLPAGIDDAVGGNLDPERVTDGTTVTLQPYAGMSAGDRVELIWQGAADQSAFRDGLVVESFALAEPLVFGIPSSFIAPHVGGVVKVHYRIEHKSGVIRESGTARFVIAPLVRRELPAPRVPEATGEVLDVQDTIDGVSVVISDAQVEEGELVYLKCDGEFYFHRDDREILSGMTTEPLVFIVPHRFWREHVNTIVRVSYSVERLDDVSQESEGMLLHVED